MSDIYALNVRTVVERTGYSKSGIYREMAAKRLGYLQVGKRRLIRPSDLEAWLDRYAVKAVPAPGAQGELDAR